VDFILKTLLIGILIGIALQDFLERKVFLWLIVFSGLIISAFHFREVNFEQFILSTILNFSIVISIIIILYIYSKILLKKPLNEAFGLGDFFFFLILAIGFPTATFLVIFSFSLLFSITIHYFFKKRFKYNTIPLAGLQATFLCMIFILNWALNLKNLYLI
jgi:hypothetical protein